MPLYLSWLINNMYSLFDGDFNIFIVIELDSGFCAMFSAFLYY